MFKKELRTYEKSRIVIILLVIILITVSLYQTLATDITMNKTNVLVVDLSYTFNITDTTGRVVNVKSGATKILDLFLTNPNNGIIVYYQCSLIIYFSNVKECTIY